MAPAIRGSRMTPPTPRAGQPSISQPSLASLASSHNPVRSAGPSIGVLTSQLRGPGELPVPPVRTRIPGLSGSCDLFRGWTGRVFGARPHGRTSQSAVAWEPDVAATDRSAGSEQFEGCRRRLGAKRSRLAPGAGGQGSSPDRQIRSAYGKARGRFPAGPALRAAMPGNGARPHKRPTTERGPPDCPQRVNSSRWSMAGGGYEIRSGWAVGNRLVCPASEM